LSPRRAQSAANFRNYLETRGRYVPDAHRDNFDAHRDNFVLGLIFFTSLGMIPGVHYAGGSHLLGAFLAGLCYCTDHRTHHVWTRQVKRVMKWLMTIFFGCTIAFEIPIRELFSGTVVKSAAIYFVAIVGKLATGVWAFPLNRFTFFTVGFSMAAWGEFAFVVASAAKAQHLIDQVSAFPAVPSSTFLVLSD
jgi:Kef-type K+ transport system membrane component KefB